jgi:hypothetical protein
MSSFFNDFTMVALSFFYSGVKNPNGNHWRNGFWLPPLSAMLCISRQGGKDVGIFAYIYIGVRKYFSVSYQLSAINRSASADKLIASYC